MRITPTKSEAGLSLWSDDFRLKSSLTAKISRRCKRSAGFNCWLVFSFPECREIKFRILLILMLL